MSIRRRMLAVTLTTSVAIASGCAASSSGGESAGSGGGAAPEGAVELTAASDYTELDPELVAAAEKESGSLIWYDSSPADQANEILSDFRKEYPFVKEAKHVVLRAGDVGSRVAQESQAGSSTADVVTVDAATLGQLNERKLLTDIDWTANGAPEEVAPNDTMIVSGASVFVFLYNTDEVSKGDAPKTWDDIVDPKWEGEAGTWEKPYAFAELVPALGGDKATEYHDNFTALKPSKYQSTFPLAQAVGAGEVNVGVGIHHAAQPAMTAGSPIGVSIPDPTPITLIYSSVPTKSKNSKTGELFATWLTTQKGATSYDEATQRGNVLLPGTDAHDMVEGRELSDFAADDAAELTQWLGKFAR